MVRLRLGEYREEKPHFKKRIVWMVLNKIVFPLLTRVGRNWIARVFGMKISGWCSLNRSVSIFAPWNLEVGNALIGPGVVLYNKDKIKIGDAVIISQDAYLCTASHDITSPTMDLITKPIIIGDNVWIASRATILPGVTIGEGAVVGCSAVVAKDVPPWSVVVGNPAQVAGKRELSINME